MARPKAPTTASTSTASSVEGRVSHEESPRVMPVDLVSTNRAIPLLLARVRSRMISLTIDHVTKRFGEIIALHRIDLAVGAGEIFFLLGPSGCGKTTLLRSIAGFYIPEEGRILFGDEDVTRLPPHLRNTGMMFQSYALWPHMTVAQNVAFGLEERKVAAPDIAP